MGYELIFLVAGLALLRLVWYLRGRRHRAIFNTLAPLLDELPNPMETGGPILGGEDRIVGRFGGRDTHFSIEEPDRGHEVSRFRIILGSRTHMPFTVSVQRRMLFGLTREIQRGRRVKTEVEEIDKRYWASELTALTTSGWFRRLGGASGARTELEENLNRRLKSWLTMPETIASFETLFEYCGVDYLATRIEYPGGIYLRDSRSGVTAVLRRYSKRQLELENVRRILTEMDSLIRSTERLMEVSIEPSSGEQPLQEEPGAGG